MDTMQRHSGTECTNDDPAADKQHQTESERSLTPGEDPNTLATDAAPVKVRGNEPKAPDADKQATASIPAEDPGPAKKLKPKLSTVLVMLVVALVGVAVILYAWRLPPFATAVVTTENSYVRGQITVLAPQVNGYVADVLVQDYQMVDAGEPLLRIDDRIYRQQLEQAEASREQALANLANADQTVAQNEAEIGARQADLSQAQAELVRAQADAGRASELTNRGLKPQLSLIHI